MGLADCYWLSVWPPKEWDSPERRSGAAADFANLFAMGPLPKAGFVGHVRLPGTKPCDSRLRYCELMATAACGRVGTSSSMRVLRSIRNRRGSGTVAATGSASAAPNSAIRDPHFLYLS